MPYTWDNDIQPSTAALANEIKTKIDLELTARGTSHTWVNLPVVAGNLSKAAEINELRAAADLAKDTPGCTSENVAYDNGADASKDNTVDSADNLTADTTKDSNVYGIYNNGVFNLTDTGYWYANDIGVHNVT